MVVDAGIVLHIVGDELVVLVRGDASDLVAAERDAAVDFAVCMGVASRTRQQMETSITVTANMRPFYDLGMDAVPLSCAR